MCFFTEHVFFVDIVGQPNSVQAFVWWLTFISHLCDLQKSCGWRGLQWSRVQDGGDIEIGRMAAGNRPEHSTIVDNHHKNMSRYSCHTSKNASRKTVWARQTKHQTFPKSPQRTLVKIVLITQQGVVVYLQNTRIFPWYSHADPMIGISPWYYHDRRKFGS